MTSRILKAVAFVLIALAAPGSTSAQTPPARIAIAVLPLVNGSGDKTQDYFAEGLTDEIAASLTKVPAFAVLARSSIFRFKDQPRDPDSIARTLKADYLIDGTAQQSAGRVRISARLLRGNGGALLWSQDYEENFAKIFDIEEDIAEKIASALHAPTGLKPGEALVRNRAKDLAAYQDFLRAKTLARARGQKPLADAAAVLEQVLAREPDYAPAAALLAYDYALTPLFDRSLRSGLPEQERKIAERALPQADILARRAVALDPKGADGFVALGYANLVQRKMLAAEDAFRQALSLDPNQADGLHGYSQFLAAMGRIKESLAMRDHLQAVEPYIVNYTADTAEIYWLAGDTDKAIAMLQPFRPGRTLELALIEASVGRYYDAAAAIREMPATNYPDGMTEAAARILDSAPARAAAPESLPKLGNLGFAYMHVGAPERVLEFYQDELRAGYFQPISTTWFWAASYAPVRRTPRFKGLVRDLGLVDYWRARGWPAQCRPMGADDFSCS